MKLKLIETAPLPDRPKPPGGWKKNCGIEDHHWILRCEAGSLHLECVNAHGEEELNEMEPTGVTPGCLLGAENLVAEFGPFTLKWEKESHGWEYPNDYDCWAVVVDRHVSSK